MVKKEVEIFDKVYQSYLTGGDIYCFKYNTNNTAQIDDYKRTIRSLEEKGLITVLFQSDTKTRMSITENGIDIGNNSNI